MRDASPKLNCPTTPSASMSLALGIALLAAVLAVALRLVNVWFVNLSMVGALGLFAGARLRASLAFCLPLGVMVVSDLLLWQLKDWKPFNLYAYASFAIYVALGLLLRRSSKAGRVVLTCLAGSIQFFLLTNFGSWLSQSLDPVEIPSGQAFVWMKEGTEYPVGMLYYARNAEGLLTSYLWALPFTSADTPAAMTGNAYPFQFAINLVVGDLLFCLLLFGSHAALASLHARRALVPVPRDR